MLSTPKRRLGSRLAFSSRRSFTSSGSVRNVNGDATQKPVMNRYSRIVTQPKTQGASQARLFPPSYCSSFRGKDTRLTSFFLIVFHHHAGHAVRHRGCKLRRRLPKGNDWRCKCLVRPFVLWSHPLFDLMTIKQVRRKPVRSPPYTSTCPYI